MIVFLGEGFGMKRVNRILIMAVVVALAFTSLNCATTHRSDSVNQFLGGNRSSAIEGQREAARRKGKSLALENLRLASMLIATGKMKEAEKALRIAAGLMTTFKADGEFAAMIGAESSKEWKGEPYEKVGAFLELAMLFYRKGDRSNALAMTKSAVLADSGTQMQHYRSDSIAAWTLQAILYQGEGEMDAAYESMDRAIDSYWSRKTVEALSKAIPDAVLLSPRNQKNKKLRQRIADYDGIALAKDLLAASIWAGTYTSPRDPAGAVRVASNYARSLVVEQKRTKKKDRLDTVKDWSKAEFDVVNEILPDVSAQWSKAVRDLPGSIKQDCDHFAGTLELILKGKPNVVLLVESGRGPRKTRAGKHGQLLVIATNKDAQRLRTSAPSVVIGDHTVQSIWLDSASFQATTRGGRKVDAINQGKAVFKDTSKAIGIASLITGAALLSQADDLGSGAGIAGAALAVVGIASLISSAATEPEADIRQWEFIPEAWLIVTANLPAGQYKVKIRGYNDFGIRVPAYEQTADIITPWSSSRNLGFQPEEE